MAAVSEQNSAIQTRSFVPTRMRENSSALSEKIARKCFWRIWRYGLSMDDGVTTVQRLCDAGATTARQLRATGFRLENGWKTSTVRRQCDDRATTVRRPCVDRAHDVVFEIWAFAYKTAGKHRVGGIADPGGKGEGGWVNPSQAPANKQENKSQPDRSQAFRSTSCFSSSTPLRYGAPSP